MMKRDQIEEKYKWQLEDMFSSDEQWEKEYSELKGRVDEISVFQGKIKDENTLLKLLKLSDDLDKKIERLYVYSHMRKDQDNGFAFYQAMADRSMALMVELSSASSYITPEILELEPETLEKWRNLPEFAIYRHGLGEVARGRAHILSKEEEKLLALTGEIAQSPKNIYSMLDYADLKFPSVQTDEGEEQITHGNFIHFMENLNRDMRKETFDKFYTTYKSMRNTYGATLNSSVKADVFYSNVRGYKGALEASLFGDKVEREVYESLIGAIHEKLPSLHRYMSLKKRALGFEELHMYDIYVPLSDAEFGVEYEKALEMVKDSLAPLGSEYQATLDKAFSERWIDVYENEGKTSGAYCWGAYGTHPYVLLNYQKNINSIFTITHEMGHAMHSYYSDLKQEHPNAQYKIFVAEVASTVNESLLMKHLMANVNDENVRLRLINYYLEQFRTTVFRQVMFAEFEMIIHEKCQAGEPLTPELIEKIYLDLNKQYYGEGMVIDELIGMEWARISHFYNSFYVYKYSTGFSAAVALSNAILNEGEKAVSRYMEFLSAGGSDYPVEILKRAGVDLTTSQPVISALDAFDNTLDELEKLLVERGK